MDQFTTFLANNPMLTAAWVGIFLAIIFISIRIKLSPIKQLSPQEMTFLVNKQEGVIVDTRSEKEFKTSHIVDSKHVTAEKINKNDIASLEKFKERPIIVVCTAGISASKAADQLAKSGFKQVNILKGGMNAWINAGLPVIKK
ncbi:rhodanese-like domain-containing protein [Thalassotalea fusca]